MYEVVRFFTDLQDNHHAYNAGDIFPREGMVVSEDRLKELSSKNNKQKAVLIKEIPEKATETPKEEPQEVKTGVDSPKKTKSKRNTKKTQE